MFLGINNINSQSIENAILKVGTSDTVGPLNLQGLHGKVLGIAYLSNTDNPDIFLQSDSLYPDFSIYKYRRRSSDGVPIFGEKTVVQLPYDSKLNYPSSIYQTADNQVHLVWYNDKKIYRAVYDEITNIFSETSYFDFPEFVYEPTSLSGYVNGEGNICIIASIPSGSLELPSGNPVSKEYIPFLRAGGWRGTLNYEGLYEFIYTVEGGIPAKTSLISPTVSEIYLGYQGATKIDLDNDFKGFITGSYFGALYYYKRNDPLSKCEKRIHIVDERGNAIRNPGMKATPILYPDEEGNHNDIIVISHGGIYYYKFKKEFTDRGNPVYFSPLPVLEENANMYGSTFATPTVVDFDGDGMLDIVSGNSQGFILFYKNKGTNETPLFLPGEYIKVNGRILCVQPGYGESVEGPVNARLGYVGANVIDWDGDGFLDILTNDSRGKHSLYKGTSNNGDYRFKKEASLFVKDLDLRGTGRCRPGIALLSGKMAYITLDDEDEFHLYWRIDDRNLEDGGKLKLNDGSVIKANYLFGNATGRIRIELADWDGDGKKDLLLGVDKWHSVPNETTGLPANQNSGEPSATVLFLKNSGTEENPVFEFPTPVLFKNEQIRLGNNAPGVCVSMLGNIQNGRPNLLIADERGAFYLLDHKDIDPFCDIATDLPGTYIDKTKSSQSGTQISNPSIIQLPDESLCIAYSNDNKTIITKSSDGGLTWQKISVLDYGKNPSLFYVNNQLYLIGSAYNAENCVILKSTDNGYSWTSPLTTNTGLLLGSTASNTVKVVSTPVVEYNGRIYKGIEQEDNQGNRKIGFMSAAITDDLLLRTRWTYSNYLSMDISLNSSGAKWMNGCIVLTVQNDISILPNIKGGNSNETGIINLSNNTTASFDTESGAISMPGGGKKFTVRYDASSGKYWAITNNIRDTENIGGISPDLIYNTLSIISSPDLKSWNVEQEVLYHQDFQSNGFIHTDWLFVGNDIIGVCALSWDDCEGSVPHIEEANYLIGFKVENVK